MWQKQQNARVALREVEESIYYCCMLQCY